MAGGERLYKVINGRYALVGEPSQTLQSLGEELGISRERVRQLQEKVLKRGRARSRQQSLEAELQCIASSLLRASPE